MSDMEELVPLRTAIDLHEKKVNLLGVIVEFGLPKKTKGTDYFCVLKIVDDSYQKPEISVNVFAKDLSDLPCVKSPGDIIHLSRVVIKSHNGEVNAVFNKKFSSYALFEGKSSKNLTPYQASTIFCLRDQDEKPITSLRTWSLDFQMHAGLNEYLLSLKDIKGAKNFDIVCKILFVCEVSKDEWVLFVWDGTDTPPLSIDTKLENETNKPLPLQLESLPLSRDILCSFPRVGTILRVFADKAYEQLGLHFQGTGQWVKLRHITCNVESGMWHGVFLPASRVRLLPIEDETVKQCQRSYNERISSKQHHWPLSSFPGQITDYEHTPTVTLMDLLTYSEVTAKFKCIVRVVALYPWRAEDFRSPLGMREYRIRLTLEDPTARIHAFLYAEDGVKFFEGYPPVDVLAHKRNKLLGITENEEGLADENIPRNPPWIECCIKSYYLDKNKSWESRKYRVFGTRLV